MPYIGKSPSAGVRQRYQYTATAGQTTFTGTDLGNLTLTYTDNNFVDVFQNGVLLKGGGTDYTATSGTSVVLATGASVSDVIEIIVYDVFSVGNFFNRTDSDSRYVNVDGDTMTGTLALNVSGSSHLTTTTAGTSNFVLGVNAGNSIASGGNYNVALGDEAGTAITTGDENVCIGYQAGDAITTGTQNVAIGSNALSTEDENHYNVAIGREALQTLNGADYNVAVGRVAGKSLTTGGQNTLVGANCGDTMTTGARNVAMGYGSLDDNVLGQRNVAIGYLALKSCAPTAEAQGVESFNTAVGYEAGMDITTGVHNTFIGAGAADDVTTANRCTVVGYNNNTSSNTTYDEIVIGNNVNGNGNSSFTFGTGSSDSAIANGATSISAPSDQRYKENIETSTAGLGFINDLRPVTFKWKMEKDVPTDHRAYVEGSEKRVMNAKDDLYHGFIAQEVKTVVDNHAEVKNYDELWSENVDGRQRLAPAFLIPMLTKAVQELSAKNEALEARIKKLEDGE